MSGNEAKIVQLLSYLAGRGYPTVSGSDRQIELEVMRIVRSLENQQKGAKETHDLLAGNWRLVFSTSEQLATLSAIPGGPLKVYFESFGNDTVHIAAPFKGLFLLLVYPLVMMACLSLAVTNNLSFLAALFTTVLTFRLVARFAPSGLYASRRVGLTVSEDMVVKSRLERDVMALFASQLSFDKESPDPLAKFCKKFDDASGSRDPLKVGFLFGWRLVPKPFMIHFITHETTRKEKIMYIDETVRIMIGGDFEGRDGVASNALSIYVRAQH